MVKMMFSTESLELIMHLALNEINDNADFMQEIAEGENIDLDTIVEVSENTEALAKLVNEAGVELSKQLAGGDSYEK